VEEPADLVRLRRVPDLLQVQGQPAVAVDAEVVATDDTVEQERGGSQLLNPRTDRTRPTPVPTIGG